MAEAADIPTQRKVKKSVTFNNEDSIEQYSSPYCDPSFMSTESPSGRSINEHRHVYLNQTEKTIVQMWRDMVRKSEVNKEENGHNS